MYKKLSSTIKSEPHRLDIANRADNVGMPAITLSNVSLLVRS